MRVIGSALVLAMLAAAAARAQCAGDCDGDARVGVAELTLGVRMVLEGPAGFACASQYDLDLNGFVTVGEVIDAVDNGLLGCPQCPPLTSAFAAPCHLSAAARCADLGTPGEPLAGFALTSDGERVELTLLRVDPALRFRGQVVDELEANITSVIRGANEPVAADALLELTRVYTDGRQTYRLFLRSPQIEIDNCEVEQFFGAFSYVP